MKYEALQYEAIVLCVDILIGRKDNCLICAGDINSFHTRVLSRLGLWLGGVDDAHPPRSTSERNNRARSSMRVDFWESLVLKYMSLYNEFLTRLLLDLSHKCGCP